jgi:hypothetical protein
MHVLDSYVQHALLCMDVRCRQPTTTLVVLFAGLNPSVWYRRMLLEQVGLILLSVIVMLYMYM